ncbi:MAG TPA: TetR/AcrR family transcriptional regulator [Candidatus Binatia bacterium]|nr:TetR/AcrR family transcriptional regulator [Candidatus Binatia bacterium]
MLDAALTAFAEQGYSGTSVRDLCRRLGVSHNLVHQRYRSKEALWYAAVDRGFAALAFELGDALSKAPDDDLARLRAVLVRFLEVSAAWPALLKIMNQESAAPGPRLDYLFERHIAPASWLVTGVLRRLHRQGRVRDVAPATFHFLLTHGAGGVLSLTALTDRFARTFDPAVDRRTPDGVRRYAEDVVELLLAGMLI